MFTSVRRGLVGIGYGFSYGRRQPAFGSQLRQTATDSVFSTAWGKLLSLNAGR